MKEYTFTLWKKHEIWTRSTHEVQADTIEEARAMFTRAFHDGKIEEGELDAYVVYETLEPTGRVEFADDDDNFYTLREG